MFTFGYSFYGILLTMALLVYRFPSDALRDYLKASFVRINPQIVLSIGKVFPFFPFGIKLMETQLSLKEEPEVLLFRADSFFVCWGETTFTVQPGLEQLVGRALVGPSG